MTKTPEPTTARGWGLDALLVAGLIAALVAELALQWANQHRRGPPDALQGLDNLGLFLVAGGLELVLLPLLLYRSVRPARIPRSIWIAALAALVSVSVVSYLVKQLFPGPGEEYWLARSHTGSPEDRAQAIYHLKSFGRRLPTGVCRELVSIAVEPDGPVSRAAHSVLSNEGADAAGVIAERIAGQPPEARKRLLSTLASMSARNPVAQAQILLTLDDPDPDVVAHALYMLGVSPERHPDTGKRVIPLLAQPRHRAAALSVLARAEAGADVVVPAILSSLTAGRTEDATYLAAYATDPRIRDQLARLAHSTNESVRYEALRAIKRADPVSPEMVAALIDGLRGPDRVRDGASEALQGLGPRARAAVPALLEMARTDDARGVRALYALGAIGPAAPETLPALLALLNDPRRTDHRTVIQQLNPFGAAAAPAVPRLIELLAPASPQDQGEILSALEAIGPAARQAVPRLEALLHSSYGYHAQIVGALRRIDPDAAERAQRQLNAR